MDTGPSKGASVNRPARRHERHQVKLPVRIQDEHNRSAGQIVFDTLDLSLSGAFLISSLLFEIDEELVLSFELPGHGAVQARGRVVRLVREKTPGMGIEFVELSEQHRQVIKTFLEKESGHG